MSDDWSFWDLNDEHDDIPQPDGWNGAYDQGPAGEVWHSGGNHWNRTWVSVDLKLEITTGINSGYDIVTACELVNFGDEDDPMWQSEGEIVEQVEIDRSDIDAEQGTPEYYRAVDKLQLEAVKELLAEVDPDFDAE